MTVGAPEVVFGVFVLFAAINLFSFYRGGRKAEEIFREYKVIAKEVTSVFWRDIDRRRRNWRATSPPN